MAAFSGDGRPPIAEDSDTTVRLRERKRAKTQKNETENENTDIFFVYEGFTIRQYPIESAANSKRLVRTYDSFARIPAYQGLELKGQWLQHHPEEAQLRTEEETAAALLALSQATFTQAGNDTGLETMVKQLRSGDSKQKQESQEQTGKGEESSTGDEPAVSVRVDKVTPTLSDPQYTGNGEKSAFPLEIAIPPGGDSGMETENANGSGAGFIHPKSVSSRKGRGGRGGLSQQSSPRTDGGVSRGISPSEWDESGEDSEKDGSNADKSFGNISRFYTQTPPAVESPSPFSRTGNKLLAHREIEQRRRAELKDGLKELIAVLPEGHFTPKGSSVSQAYVLEVAARQIKHLRATHTHLEGVRNDLKTQVLAKQQRLQQMKAEGWGGF